MQTAADQNDALVAENERLRARLAQYEAAVNHMPQALCMYGQDERIVVCNTRYADVLDLPAELVRPGVHSSEIIEAGIAAGHFPGLAVSEVREQLFARISAAEESGTTTTLARSGRTFALNHCTTADGQWVATFEEKTAQLAAESALRENETRLRLVQDATGLADFESLGDGISVCSDRFFEQMGLPVGDNTISAEEWLARVHPDDREMLHANIERALVEGDSSFAYEFRVVRADTGEIRWVACRTMLFRDENGQATRTIGAHVDISESKRVEEALRESEERFRLAAEAAGLGVWDYDVVSRRRQWSDRLREILGVSAEVEASPKVAIACVHPEDRQEFGELLLHSREVRGPGRFAETFRVLRQTDLAERWVAINGWKTVETGGEVSRVIMTVLDVTDEKTAEQRIRWSANHDPLTRLANRSLFNEKLEEAIARSEKSGRSVALFTLDLDYFKQINDTLGHDVGDELLKLFAERLRSGVRSGDTVARLGGDEFAIIVPDLGSEERVRDLTDAILDRLREPFVHKGRVLDCRASLGVSIYPTHGTSSEELLKNSDIALYAAKDGGRGIARMFEPQLRAHVNRRSSMIQLARGAIRDGRIEPFYQPKLRLDSGELDGFEALLRWRDENGRIRAPASITAAFEDFDLAASISDRVIDGVIADMRGWLDRGVEFGHVAINAAPAEFRRDTFAERLLERMRGAGLPPDRLQLEVTETVFLGRGADYVHRALKLLSAEGIRIALDDFGTGYASLRHLKQFPVEIIKIDQSFVRDMEKNPGDEAIIGAVLNLGRSLDIEVVAEGVETERQARRLLTMGCKLVQGYLFSRAMAASEVPAFVGGTGRTPLRAQGGASALRLVRGER